MARVVATFPRGLGPLGEAALDYARRGWPVLPLKIRGKAPDTDLVPHGASDATTDESTVRYWWTTSPLANVGVRIPEGMVVIDVDPRAGGLETLDRWAREGKTIPPTVTCETGGGGYHFWFTDPDGRLEAGTLAPGVEAKRGNMYVVCPPSIHPETELAYVWPVA